MAEEKKAGGGFASGMFPKIILLIGIVLIASVFIFGIKLTFEDIVWTTLKIVVGIVLVVLVVKGFQAMLAKSEFSPTRRWKEKLIRCAELRKPFNVKKLYIRGEDMLVYSLWGKISGICFVPYLSATPKRDGNGSYLYVQKKDKNGQLMFDKKNKPIMTYDYEVMHEKTGEWVFIISRGFWIFAQKEIVRAHKNLVSDIGETVFIKSPNLINIGDYFYPSQQWQTDIMQISQQHQTEVLVETYQEHLDLVGVITTMTLKADPVFRKAREQNIETVASAPSTQ
jgi:hypothetical protein